MTKFKVGDKVRFKSIAEAEEAFGASSFEEFNDHLGGILTVRRVDPDIDGDGEFVLLEGLPGVYARRLRPVRTRKVITKQGIFNHVYRFLVKQGRPCGSGLGCYYRGSLDESGDVVRDGDGTLACAAGCLLYDDEAKKLLSLGWGWELLERHGFTPNRFFQHVDFIDELQKIHDCWARGGSRGNWLNEMASFAALHGLTVTDV